MKYLITLVVLVCCSLLIQSHPLESRLNVGTVDGTLRDIKDDLDRIREVLEIEFPSESQLLPRVNEFQLFT